MARLVVELQGSQAERQAKQLEASLSRLGQRARRIDGDFSSLGRRIERSAANSFRRLGQAAAVATTAMAALAGVVAVRLVGSFLEAATTAERLQVRLSVLLGSVEEGNKLFEDMSAFASRVPFEYREIMESATMLSGVLRGGREEISAWMPLIADLAAAAGLGIRETTEQVMRMLSAGAASADRFRERGVLAMLGFQAGVSVSAEETRRRLIEAWEETGSQFRGATDALADTWEGQTSMMADAWFQFRNEVMDQGLFEVLKDLASELVSLAQDPEIQELASDIGVALAEALGKFAAMLEDAALGWVKFKAEALAATSALLDNLARLLSGVLSLAEIPSKALGPLANLIPGSMSEEQIARLRKVEENLRTLSDTAGRLAVEAGVELAKGFLDSGEAASSAASDFGEVQRSAETVREELEKLSGQILDALAENTREWASAQEEVLDAFEGMDFIQVIGFLEQQGVALPETAQGWRDLADAVRRADEALRNVSSVGANVQLGPQDSGGGLDLEEIFGGGTTNEDLGLDIDFDKLIKDGNEALGEIEINWSEAWSDIANTMVSEMAGAFQSILDGSKSTSEAMGDIFVAAFAAMGFAVAGAAGAAVGGLLGGVLADSFGLNDDRDKVAGVVGLGGEETFGNTLEAERLMNDAMLSILEGVEELERLFGFTASSFEEIRVVIHESGRAAVEINGNVRAVFNNVEDAKQFAAQLAVSFADVAGGVGDFVEMLQTAANQAENAEEFNQAVGALREIMEVELGETGTAVFDAIQHFHGLSDALQDVGLSGARAGEVLARDLGRIRDDITGTSKSARQLFEERRKEFNREIERERQRQEAALAMAQSQIAAAEAEIARIASIHNLTEAQLTAAEIEGEIAGSLTESQREALDAANKMLIEARQSAETARAALDNLPDPIGADEFRDEAAIRRRERDRERVQDFLRDHELSQLSDLARAHAELATQREELIEAAHGDAEAIKALNEAIDEQIRAANQAAVEDVFGRLRDFEQDPNLSPFRQSLQQVGATASEIREDFLQLAEDLDFGSERIARGLERIENAEQQRLQALGEQEGQALLLSALEFLGRSEEAERIRFELQQAELQIRFQELQIAVEKHNLELTMLDQLGELVGEISELSFEDFQNLRRTRPVRRFTSAVSDAGREAERMARRLAQAKEGISDFLLGLERGESGGVSTMDALTAAEGQFEEILRQARSGNIQALEQFPEISQSFLNLAREAFASGPEFQEIFERVREAGLELLGVQRVTEDNVVFDQRFFEQQQQVVESQRAGFGATVRELQQLRQEARDDNRQTRQLLQQVITANERQRAIA